MTKLSRVRIDCLLARILGAATVLFLVALIGGVAAYLGYQRQGWLMIMAAVIVNIGLIVLFAVLKSMSWNAPD
jgi:hypothetical protein